MIRRLVISAILSVLAAGSLCAAEKEAIALDIPAQPLRYALNQLAQQANIEVVFYTDLGRDMVAKRVEGKLTTEAALEQLLAGSGLQYEYIAERTVAILPLKEIAREGREDGEVRMAQVEGSATAEAGRPPVAATEGEPSEGVKLDEIVVTGTHIRGTPKTTSAVLVIDADQIQRTGYSSTQDLFESLPQNFGGGASADDHFNPTARAFNFSAGAGINLRGLGTSSTLVLLNGHRVAPSGFGSFVDISAIPLSAIERVEILTDGSSAIYGSDAVGGVVNILLKDSYDGIEARARYGSVTDGGRDEKLYALSAGTEWSGGGLFFGTQYQSLDTLYTDERAVSSLVPRPAALLPYSNTKNVTLSGSQRIAEDFKISADVLFARRDVDSVSTNASASSILNGLVDQKDLSVALNLDYEISERWSLRVSGVHGRQRLDRHQAQHGLLDGLLLDTSHESHLFKANSAEVLSNLSLWKSRAGTAALALGGAVRRENLDGGGVEFGEFPFEIRNRREITSGFGELHLPLVGPENGVRGMKELQLSVAVRNDHYSDFGSTTNPYFGLRWAINDAVALRASQNRSFRAPVAIEAFRADVNTNIFAVPPGFFVTPDGSDAALFFLDGGRGDLKPERAKSFAFGLEFTPMRDLVLGLNYYDIAYQDRIVTPPFDLEALVKRDIYGVVVSDFADDAAAEAFLDEMLAQGAIFNDFTGTGAAGVRYLLDLRQQNATQLDQKGYDLTVDYHRTWSAGTLTLGANATRIRSILTGFAGGTRRFDQVETVGNPTELRARLDAGFDTGKWSINAGVNYVDGYTNTALVTDVPVQSWTTVDLSARLALGALFHAPLLERSTLSLSVQNAFDAAPPLVDFGLFPDFVRYDAANANPLGRFIALDVRTAW